MCIFSILFGCTEQLHIPAPVIELKKNYSTITPDSYQDNTYEVKKGDTLYFISYLTNKNVEEIIHFNQLKFPYTIYPGQKLQLQSLSHIPIHHTENSSIDAFPEVIKSVKNAKQKLKLVEKDLSNKVDQSKSKGYVEFQYKDKINANKTFKNPKLRKNNKVTNWLWPTKGKVIKEFSSSDQGNKGIDIAGNFGQPVISSADGLVVYSGNALRGYGNLVIIKHNNDYISAYAYNKQLLVSEGQDVKAGQKIAMMGNSEIGTVCLHFEIRYKGKSVNPKLYLPNQQAS
ncbi:lipoprotein NlpD [Candidatus Photodesmus katoptron Akat1]|uniref:Lipoprotein NlpD n=2 Tax=Candidatus Photodesmus anomalopis TaxID=28176 RepID=S3E0R1_9GAMM|nr:lipoprotein NlpD [Candidatus Photodesmus katoptron Akat1]